MPPLAGFAAFIRDLRLHALSVVNGVTALREASKARGRVAMQVAVEAGKGNELSVGHSSRVIRQAAMDLGAASTVGRDALTAVATHRDWLPLPLDVDPLLISWFDVAQHRPLWGDGGGKGAGGKSGGGKAGKAGGGYGEAGGEGGDAFTPVLPILAPASVEEVPPAKQAHSLVAFMRINTADASIRQELPPQPGEVFAHGLAPAADIAPCPVFPPDTESLSAHARLRSMARACGRVVTGTARTGDAP